MEFKPQSSLQQLVRLLKQGRVLSQADVCNELDINSRRHVRRLVRKARNEGLQVHERFEDGKKVYFLGEEDLYAARSPVSLSNRHMLALVVAAEASRSVLKPTPLFEDLEAALESLNGALEHAFPIEPAEHARKWHFRNAPSEPIGESVFRRLVRAIRRNQSVRVDYRTASTGETSADRKLDPLLIGVRSGSWLCVAYCHQRDGIRDFNMVDMSKVRLCDPDDEVAYFDIPEEFDAELYFRDRFSAVSGDEVHVIRLLVEPDRTAYFERKRYHPTQHIEQAPSDREDGRMVVSYEVEGLEEVAAWIRSWGPALKVIDPPELADRIVNDARNTINRYQNDE